MEWCMLVLGHHDAIRMSFLMSTSTKFRMLVSVSFLDRLNFVLQKPSVGWD